MKVAFVIHVRDKAADIRRAAESALAQSYGPLEIILSDQGSTDGTLQILQEIQRDYSGPQTVRVLQCPHTDLKGHPGINAHVNWIHTQTDADVLMMMSGDDYSRPQRAEYVARAFAEHNPSMVLTGIFNVSPAGEIIGYSAFPEQDGWVRTEDVISKCVGGTSSLAWKRSFFDKVGPLVGTQTYDVVLPFLATLYEGAWYVQERLHCYVAHASELNTGLEGQLRAAKTDAQKLQIEEQMHYQICSNMCQLANKVEALGMNSEVTNQVLFEQVLGRAFAWSNCREKMTIQRIQPMGIRV